MGKLAGHRPQHSMRIYSQAALHGKDQEWRTAVIQAYRANSQAQQQTAKETVICTELDADRL
ncbi:MAG: hypothetical protein FRX49_10948 [Trebouxia sp. A1-2]|nr:MAG: hypothetical protein FRX49_10948 [Trebouxia sp. A1-2]